MMMRHDDSHKRVEMADETSWGGALRIAAVGSAFPVHYYDQEALLAAFRGVWRDKLHNLDRLEALHRNVLVGGRHLALPIEEYEEIDSWGRANDAWIRVAQEIGAEAITKSLSKAGLAPTQVDALILVSVTGIATPSLDALIMNRLKLPSHIKRIPIFGLGCVGGAAGISRAADYVKAYPDQVAILLSVELCSLTLQREDTSVSNLISSGLFGDGAAAAVVVGGDFRQSGPQVRATRSIFYPETERIMGWDISERGFQIVLSSEVPDIVRNHLRCDVDGFLADNGLDRSSICRWIAHPGGPRVLEAMAESLDLSAADLAITWRSLKEVGNLSSTSVLLVLEEVMRDSPPEQGNFGLLLALGPGFCSELVLLEW
jgi:alkylresorcinol/alkylpyrone synthase